MTAPPTPDVVVKRDADDLARSVDLRRRVRTVPGARERFALRLRETGGGWHWFDATVTNCVDDPDIAGLVVNLRDISAEVEAQQVAFDASMKRTLYAFAAALADAACSSSARWQA